MIPPRQFLSREGLKEASSLLAEFGLDGWLLYDFGTRNPIAHELLMVGATTRPAFALVRAQGEPVLLRHAIEASAWSHWPGATREYVGWRDLGVALGELLNGLDTVAMEVSELGAVPSIDWVPFGTVCLVRGLGVEVVASADLVSTFYSRWSSSGLELHRQAAEIVRRTAHAAFEHAAAAAAAARPVTELELMDWIRGRLRNEGLRDQEDCIVASGSNTADPHYSPSGAGAPLTEGLVLLDLWGRHPDGGIPADQTWMGFLGHGVPDRVQEIWTAVRDARDAALSFLSERAGQGLEVLGREVDAVARSFLDGCGLADYFLHRLGHSIDRRLHGSGPNLDDLETREERRLIHGIGFSVEPGVYISGELGVRSEVNVYWAADGPEVTPARIQQELLLSPGA